MEDQVCNQTRYLGMLVAFGNSDSPQQRLSSPLEPSCHEFRLAVKLGVVSGYVFDSKHLTRNICVLTIKMSTNGECTLCKSYVRTELNPCPLNRESEVVATAPF